MTPDMSQPNQNLLFGCLEHCTMTSEEERLVRLHTCPRCFVEMKVSGPIADIQWLQCKTCCSVWVVRPSKAGTSN